MDDSDDRDEIIERFRSALFRAEGREAELRKLNAALLEALKPFAGIVTMQPSLTGTSYIFHDDGSLHKACEAARAAIAKAATMGAPNTFPKGTAPSRSRSWE